MEIASLIDPENIRTVPDQTSYIKIQSSLLDGETIILVFNRGQVFPARKENPSNVIYTPKEIQELKGLSEEEINIMHIAKKEFCGAIMPERTAKNLRVLGKWKKKHGEEKFRKKFKIEQ